MNTEPIVIGIEANPADFLADAKKIQSEMDALAHRLDKAGVSQSAYNQAVKNATQANKTNSMSITDLRSAYQIAADVARVAGDVWEETGQKFVDNAMRVGDMARALGTTTEEASRIKEVADDVGISVEKLTSSFRVAQKDGFAPTIEGLAAMSDEYLALAPGVERAQYLQDRFGKSGEEMGKLLEKGSEAIRDQAAAMDEAMVVTQEAYEQAQKFKISQDALSDSWDAFTYQVAPPLVEGLTAVVNHYRDITTSLKENGYWYTFTHQLALDDVAAKREQADAALLAADASTELGESFETEAEATRNAEQAARELTKANQEYLNTIGDVTKEIDNQKEKLDEIREKYGEGSQEYADATAEFEDNTHRRMLAMLEEQLAVDGLSEKESTFLLEQGMKWGIYSQEAVDAMAAVQRQVDAMERNIDININVHTNYSEAGQAALTNQLAGEKGYVPNQHAAGGSFMIPMSYGNEGFRMGNGDTASGGEMVNITPRGQDPNASLIAAILSIKTDEVKLGRTISEEILRASR